MPEFDDSPPTHRWVRVGYAKTPTGQIDKERLRNQPERLPAADAKRLVDDNHGRYLTDDEVAELDAERAEVADAVKPAPDAGAQANEGPPVTPSDVPAPDPKASTKPASVRGQGWGAKPDTETKEG